MIHARPPLAHSHRVFHSRLAMVALALLLMPAAAAAQNGAISGSVSAGVTPLQGAVVRIYNDSQLEIASSNATDALGAYTVPNLSPGTYYAFVFAGNVTGGYVDQLYPSTLCIGTPQPVGTYCRIDTGGPITVNTGVTTTGIDFNLIVGGAINGTVTTNGATPGSATVQLHSDLGGLETRGMIGTSTNAAGAYTLTRLPPGNYFVWAGNVTGTVSQSLHVGEVYNNQTCPQPPLSFDSTATCTTATATALAVTSGTTATANFDLALGGGIAGTVTALGVPRANVLIQVFTSFGRFARSTFTDVTGAYSVRGLPVGQYRVFTENNQGFRNEVFDDIPCDAGCLPVLANGDLVSVPADGFQSPVDFDLLINPPVIIAQPQSQTIASGQTATLAAGVTGTPPIAYQWYEGVSGNTATPIAGATSDSFTTPPLTAAASYWVRVTNAGGLTDSQTATISIGQPPTVSVSPLNQVIVSGQSTTVGSTASGTPPLSFQWYQGSSGTTTMPVPGAVTGGYTTPPLTVTTSYWLRVTNAFGSADSATATVTVGPPSITGTVISGAAPLEGAVVTIYNAIEAQAATATTNAAGAYSIIPLAAGTYYAFVNTGNVTGGYVNQLYATTSCFGSANSFGSYCRINTGTPIVLTGGAAPAINFNVPVGGSLTGTVTASGTPYANTEVQLHINAGGAQTLTLAEASTNAAGSYTITRVPAGSYYVWAGNVTGGPTGGHVGEMFDNAVCPRPGLFTSGSYCATSAATPVAVSLGAASTANLDLSPGGSISGMVSALGTPQSNITVNVYDLAGNRVGFNTTDATTDADGNFIVRGLPGGQYRVATSNSAGWADEVYNNVACNGNCQAVLSSGTQILVTVGADVPGVNFDLAAGPPVITLQPQSRTIASGQTAALLVSAGSTSALSYQWYEGASGNTTTPIPGATTLSFTTPALTATTSYWVRVTNLQGSTDSATAIVSIGQAPQITTEPASQTIASGQTATMTVVAAGTTPLTYQWYSGSSGNAGTPVPGAVSSSFTTPPLTAFANYWVRVTNAFGTDDSATANIGIGLPPTVTVSPANPTVITGGTVSLGAATSGIGPFTYQWYEGLSGATTTPIPGATSASFTTPPLAVTTRYWVRASNPFGNGDSNTATVTVGPASITGQVTGGATPLQNAAVIVYNANEVQAASVVTNAAGAFAVAPLPPGIYYAFVNTGNVTGAYINQLYPSIPCLGSTPQFSGTYCRIHSGTPLLVSAGDTVAGVNFNVPVGGSVAGTVTASGTAYASTEVQLHLDTGEAQTRLVASASTNASGGYTFARVPAGTYFVWAGNVTGGPPGGHVGEVFDNAACPRSPLNSSGDYCSTANATGVPVLSGAASTANFDLAPGGAIGGTVTFMGSVRGNVRVNAYDSGANLAGSAVTDSFGIYSIRGLPAGSYRLATADTSGLANEVYDNIACNGNCAAVLASGAEVAAIVGTATGGVNFDLTAGPPDIVLQPQSRTIVSGQTATLLVSAGSTSALSYQWYRGSSGDTTDPIAGATTFGFTTPTLTAAASYWVRLTNTQGSADSATATIAIAQAAAVVTDPANQAVAPGQSATLNVSATGTAPLHYQWYQGASGVTASPIPGATAASYTTPALTVATTYWVRVSNAYGSDDSAAATIAVGIGPAITTQPISQMIGTGQTASLTVAAAGTAPLSYQWYRGASGVTTAPIAGATASAFVTPALTAATSFWVRVTNAFGAVDSAAAAISIGVPPEITTQPQGQIIASGQTATLTIAATGTGPLSYQWYQGSSGSTAAPIAGAAGPGYATPSLATTTSYWVRVTNAFGSRDSATAAIEIGVAPAISVPPQDQTVNAGQTATLGVTATGTGPLAYQWFEGTSGTTAAPVAGATAATMTTAPITSTTRFWVRVTNAYGSADSPAATVTAIPLVGKPTELHVKSMSGNTLTLEWKPGQGQQPITDHLIEGGLFGQTAVLAQFRTGDAGSTFSLTAPDGRFWVQVRAIAGPTTGEPSEQMPLCLNSACAALTPKNLLALANQGDVTLAWRTPLENGVPVKHTLRVTGSLAATVDLPGDAQSFSYSGVPTGTYDFSVQSCQTTGCSAPTSPVRLTFPAPCSGAPSMPANFRATRRGRTLLVEWDLPADGPAPGGYTLSVTGSFVGAFTTAGRSLSGTVGAGTYVMSVAATNTCGASAPTAAVTVTVP